MKQIKEPVRLRTRKTTQGESLYLDIYQDGERIREFLKLYLVDGTTREVKQHNKDVMAEANVIKAQRLLDLQSKKYVIAKQKKATQITLIGYMNKVANDYAAKGSSTSESHMHNAMSYLKRYKGENTLLKNVDKHYVKGFIDFLYDEGGCTLAQSTIYSYFMMLAIALNKAVQDDLIPFNPCSKIPAEDRPQRTTGRRDYLTMDEVRALMNTECDDIRVKMMFLFSCFTGLRYSDMKALTWNHIHKTEDGGLQIEMMQQKTKDLVVIPLSENALHFLPAKSAYEADSDYVFASPNRCKAYDILHKWALMADVRKNVTFHIARHTYATLLLTYGADIYTVSKLLGHQSVKTTQIYAKVVDATKKKAVNLIPKI